MHVGIKLIYITVVLIARVRTCTMKACHVWQVDGGIMKAYHANVENIFFFGR